MFDTSAGMFRGGNRSNCSGNLLRISRSDVQQLLRILIEVHALFLVKKAGHDSGKRNDDAYEDQLHDDPGN